MAYPVQIFPPPNSGKWTTGLCGCCEKPKICFIGHWCPCILVGRYVEVLDQGATSFCSGCCLFCCIQWCSGLGFIYTCHYRGQLRQKFGLPPDPCPDILTDYFCLLCSICQVYRELLNRGIDPALGFEGVRHVYQQPAQVPPSQHVPPPQQYMGR